MTRILLLTHSPINDFSFGGSQRANHLRNALRTCAELDTLIINGGPHFLLGAGWSDDRVCEGKISVYGASLEGLRQRQQMARWVKSIIDRESYDFIVAQYLDLASLVPRRWRSRMIFDPDDFIKTLPPGTAFSLIKRLKLMMRNAIAQRVANQALHVWYANPNGPHLPQNPRRSFMPNVIGIPDPARPRPSPLPQRLLMVGLFAHAPNVEGLSWFAEHVWPTLAERFPAAELHAVGQHNQNLVDQLPAVHFHGYVDDLASEYDRAALVIAPIRSGGGTQIKVIDALVHERPLVASNFAFSGFARDLNDGEHLLVADKKNAWITACTNLLNDPIGAAKIAKCGCLRATSKYGPERMVIEVKSTLDSLI